ncbi:MAG TPA: glycosyltransferase family 39 protein [Acidobacteriaceae bacterium]
MVVVTFLPLRFSARASQGPRAFLLQLAHCGPTLLNISPDLRQGVIKTTEAQPTESHATTGPAQLVLKLGVVFLFSIVLAVVLFRGIETSGRPFDYPHAFVSADVATSARTFARVGILQLHGVPVDNNPPIGSEDSYTHWPPLLPILLSLCYRAFGVSERVAHLLMLCVLVATAILVFRIGERWLGLIGGALAGFFWLTLPVTLQFGHLVSQQALMTLFMVAAVLAFLDESNAIGAGLLFLGAFTSWEVVLIAPGLLLAACWRPELRRCALAAAIGVGTGVACVAALYLLNSPSLAVDALQAAKFYMGTSPSYSHILPPQPSLGAAEQVRRMLLNNVSMLGPLGLGAVLQFFTARFHNRIFLLASLSTPWLVWCVIMRNHMARHHFEFVIAAPFVALALAWMAATPSKTPALKIGILAALAGVQVLTLPKPPISDGYDSVALIRYGQGIRRFTEQNSIVMAPLVSAVPLYYSERHIVRGVDGADSAALRLPALRREFPASPIYLAIPPSLLSNFPGGRVAASNGDVVILRFSDVKPDSIP